MRPQVGVERVKVSTGSEHFITVLRVTGVLGALCLVRFARSVRSGYTYQCFIKSGSLLWVLFIYIHLKVIIMPEDLCGVWFF